jgi:hypothetical protein
MADRGRATDVRSGGTTLIKMMQSVVVRRYLSERDIVD